MLRTILTVVFSIASMAFCAVGASADEGVSGSIGLSVATALGSHAEQGFRSSIDGTTLPILQANVRDGRYELFVESLPVSPNEIGELASGRHLATNLTFLNAVARAYDRNDRFWIGGGETLYNQSTVYTPVATDSSRVVGGRYEIGSGLLHDPKRIRLWVDIVPALKGNVATRYRGTIFAQPELGTQVETQLAVTNAHGPYALAYGVRYINYVAHFTRYHTLADRNVGVLPYATFAYRFGKK